MRIALAAGLTFVLSFAFSFVILRYALDIDRDIALAAAWVSGHIAQIAQQLEERA